MAADLIERRMVGNQLGREQSELHHQDDEVVEALRIDNTTAAIGFGLRVGLDAIAQVLRGGPGPLGERDR